MFSRRALQVLLLAVGLAGVSALSEPFPTTLSTELRRDPTSQSPNGRRDTDEIAVRDVDPATCPTIRCAAGFRPLYHEDTKKCSCISNLLPCSNAIYCGSGCHTVPQPFKDTCTCELDAGTETCPLMKCKAGHHVVYHNETQNCGCETDCPDLACIVEKHPVYHFESHSCTCEFVSELKARVEDTTVALDPEAEVLPLDEQINSYTAVKTTYTGPWTKRAEADAPTAIKTTYLGPWTKRDVQETTTFQTPGGTLIAATTPVQNPGGPMISDTTFVTSTRREPKPTACPAHNVMCEVGKQPTFNKSNGKCECEPFPSQPHRVPPRTSSATSAPISTTTPDFHTCPNLYCIAEQHPVWNATIGACTCEWIPGFGPESLR